MVRLVHPAFPLWLPVEAGIVAAAALGFYGFNRSPAKLFMGDVGSITLGFLTGYLLLELAIGGQWTSALILPAYYLSDATTTLCKRLWRGEKVWQAHSQHAYQQAVRAGFSHSEVVNKISGLNMVLVVLAMAATVSMMADVAMLVLAYGLTACLIRHFNHASVAR
jgi:UDP-N-acetylmuramyl pentapeptide phosphotransferase/UDP-N-acetylglucosamine-1-phosphate transferase